MYSSNRRYKWCSGQISSLVRCLRSPGENRPVQNLTQSSAVWYSTAYSIYYEVYSIQYTVYRRFINEIRKVCLFFFYFIFIFYCISYFYLLFFNVLYCNWCALVSKLDSVFLIYHVFSFTSEALCIACDLFERCYRNKVFFLFFSFLFSFLLKFMDKNIIMEKIQSV